MHVTNITDDYDDISSTNVALSNCTNNEKNIDIILPTLLTIPCGLSFL